MNIIFDTITKEFNVSGSFGPTGGILGFGFTQDGALPVDLQSVSKFGFTLDGVTEELPKRGKINSSALALVHQHTANLKPETEYNLTFFVEMPELGVVEGTHAFTTPRPDAPYASWIWNADKKTWEPPVQPDGEGKMWEEATQSWVIDPDYAIRKLKETDAITGARVAEDTLIALLAKNVIVESDLPQATLDRIAERKAYRDAYTGN